MLNLYFNPYPGVSNDKESIKACLISTAKSFKDISDYIKIHVHDPEGQDSIRFFKVYTDNYNSFFTPSQFIGELKKRDKELVVFLLRSIDKGSKLLNVNLSICEDLILEGFDFPAPIIEYAMRNDGMAITITDDHDWKRDFFTFINHKNQLPNIHGQDDCSPLFSWIDLWEKRNTSFIEILEYRFNIIFATGASRELTPTKEEADIIIDRLKIKRKTNYAVDNDIIKFFKTKYGQIFELRVYDKGSRIFFTIHDYRMVIGGFYRKSGSIKQNKAGEQAAKRLKKNGYI
ncbi:hypothetical protein DSCO28_70190 [Desulfosarcina ovata subsp. sediminis]|uniref:Uncharacterized protein n=1 Tax=Desulfosarcina ovata subsp. sediminis TaxID=885957 RepID=A0A5K8A1N7_9BACT|nr:hypothetical protein [Desulfosarcina ovata]BBO86453.1 hypothetical protein DSCO28_70190 [Desulfosarcina ovata subsp. sediminis]